MQCNVVDWGTTNRALFTLDNVNSKLGRQQTRAPLAAAISSCNTTITHDMNDMWCVKDRPHHRGNFPYCFRTVVWVLLRPLRFWLIKEEWRKQVQWLNVTAQWRDHLNWDRVSNHSQHHLTSFFKTLVVGPAEVWTYDLPLGRPVLSQLS